MLLLLLATACDERPMGERMARPREARTPGSDRPGAAVEAPAPAAPSAVALPMTPPPKGIPTVVLGHHSAALATGSADSARVTAQRFTAEVKRCYTRALAQDDQVEGSVTVSWELRDGRPLHAAVTTDTTADVELQDCVEKPALKVRFNTALNGQVDFAWELALRPA